jgi:hypothetical protein
MQRLLWLLVALVPAAGFGAEPIHVAMPGLTGVNVPAQLVGFYGEHLAQKLSEQGVRVTTTKQVQALIGMERQRQLAGCAEDSSCLAELSGALNADVLLVGEVASIAAAYQFNLKALDARSGKPLAGFTARVEGESLVLATLDRAAARLAADLSAKLSRPLVTAQGERQVGSVTRQAEQLQSGARPYAWLPAAVGVAGAGVGTLFLVQSRQAHDQLTATSGAPLDGRTADALRDAGQQQQTLAMAAYGVSAAALVTAGVMFALGGSSSTVEGGVALSPGGAGFFITGVLP